MLVSICRDVAKRIKNHDYLKNIITLGGGTATAQIIPILISPIITRLFDPNEFGVLATFTSLTAIL